MAVLRSLLNVVLLLLQFQSVISSHLRSSTQQSGGVPNTLPNGLSADFFAFRTRYHSTQTIYTQLQALHSSCQVPFSWEWKYDKQDAAGKLFTVKLGSASAQKKVLVAANEHARELIAAEVALKFIQDACQSSTNHVDLFDKVQFVVLPIVNEKARIKVETGEDQCARMTVPEEGNVDLNRNGDVDWGQGSYPQAWGPAPFSTYQARILRDVATHTKPLAYVDLHSAAPGMGRSLMTSWGFKPSTSPDYLDQAKMLDQVREKHCPDCKMGSNRVVIDYENPGEIIDHMYAKQGIKYSTLWEVYSGTGGGCVEMFNPPDSEYDQSVQSWADALVTVGKYVRDEVNVNERSAPEVMQEYAGQPSRPASNLLAKSQKLSNAPALPPFEMLTT